MKTLALSLFALFAASAAVFAAPKIGEPAPDFALTDINGKKHSLSEFKGKYVVLEWNNPDCPFVKKHYDSGNMQKLQAEAQKKGAVWLVINSGAQGKQGAYPADKLAQILKEKKSEPTAYLLDGEGKVGKLYDAKTTPHMFVIDPKGTLVYAGAIDSIRSPNPADIDKATNYVRVALEESMTGKPVSTPTSQPYGCSVKY